MSERIEVFFRRYPLVYPWHRLVDARLKSVLSEILPERLEDVDADLCRHLRTSQQSAIRQSLVGIEYLLGGASLIAILSRDGYLVGREEGV